MLPAAPQQIPGPVQPLHRIPASPGVGLSQVQHRPLGEDAPDEPAWFLGRARPPGLLLLCLVFCLQILGGLPWSPHKRDSGGARRRGRGEQVGGRQGFLVLSWAAETTPPRYFLTPTPPAPWKLPRFWELTEDDVRFVISEEEDLTS